MTAGYLEMEQLRDHLTGNLTKANNGQLKMVVLRYSDISVINTNFRYSGDSYEGGKSTTLVGRSRSTPFKKRLMI